MLTKTIIRSLKKFLRGNYAEDTFIWENDKDSKINVTSSDDEGPYDDFLTEVGEELLNE